MYTNTWASTQTNTKSVHFWFVLLFIYFRIMRRTRHQLKIGDFYILSIGGIGLKVNRK